MIMKCSLKDIFINILIIITIIIIIISPSEGVELPKFVPRGSVVKEQMNSQQLGASINRLQDLDSFPVGSDSQLHKIVKKQMTTCDYNDKKDKRSVLRLQGRLKSFGFEDDDTAKGDGRLPLDKPAVKLKKSPEALDTEFHLSKLAKFPKNSQIRISFPVEKKSAERFERQEDAKGFEVPEPTAEELSAAINETIDTIMNSQIHHGVRSGAKINSNQMQQRQFIPPLIPEPSSSDSSPEYSNLNKQFPVMSVDEKIKEFLQEEKLPEIKYKPPDTEPKTKDPAKKIEPEILNPPVPKPTTEEKQKDKPKDEEEILKEMKEDEKKTNEKIIKDGEEKKKGSHKHSEVLYDDDDLPLIEHEVGECNKKKNEKLEQENPYLRKKFRRIPDESDYRYYYECEARPNGCLKLRRKRCPQGQFFSFKFLKCLKADSKHDKECKTNIFKRKAFSDSKSSENMWMDVNQDSTGLPSEFQVTTEPNLKIYHLRPKRKFNENSQKELQNAKIPLHGTVRKQRKPPRSYIIRIHKKDKTSVKENEKDIDSDEDEQDCDEDEEDDEDVDDEEEGNEEEDPKDETTAKVGTSNQGFKDLFKAAKSAVTNRAKLEDSSLTEMGGNKMSTWAGKDFGDSESDKKVLIDASIKLDSTIGNVLKSLIKSKRKESCASFKFDQEALISDRGSQDQLDPELLRMYEHLMRSNPRNKRYFRVERNKKGK